jgi:hypothetical protein
MQAGYSFITVSWRRGQKYRFGSSIVHTRTGKTQN